MREFRHSRYWHADTDTRPIHSIVTKSKKYPSISIGFASAPVSFEEQINRTPEQTVPEWFGMSPSSFASVRQC